MLKETLTPADKQNILFVQMTSLVPIRFEVQFSRFPPKNGWKRDDMKKGELERRKEGKMGEKRQAT
jgi:hypothetical protein